MRTAQRPQGNSIDGISLVAGPSGKKKPAPGLPTRCRQLIDPTHLRQFRKCKNFESLTAAPSTGMLPADRQISRILHNPRAVDQTIIRSLLQHSYATKPRVFRHRPPGPNPWGRRCAGLSLSSSTERSLIDRGPFRTLHVHGVHFLALTSFVYR